MGLQQFERRIERLVEGVFARAFRSGLQPVEIGRRLTREMDLRRTLAPRGTLAPNIFVVSVAPEDAERFAPIEEELVEELVSVAKDHAHTEGYTFIGPVSVEIEVDDHQTEGTVVVSGEMTKGAMEGSVIMADGRRVTIPERGVTIGRLPECEITVTDGNVSRRHAEIRAQEGRWVLIDLGSTNGTRVNGRAIDGTAELHSGDEVQVGNTVLRLDAS